MSSMSNIQYRSMINQQKTGKYYNSTKWLSCICLFVLMRILIHLRIILFYTGLNWASMVANYFRLIVSFSVLFMLLMTCLGNWTFLEVFPNCGKQSEAIAFTVNVNEPASWRYWRSVKSTSPWFCQKSLVQTAEHKLLIIPLASWLTSAVFMETLCHTVWTC